MWGDRMLRLRPLSDVERQALRKIRRRCRCGIRRTRAAIVLQASRGPRCPQIAGQLGLSAQYVRLVVHAFNERGLDSINPQYRGGRSVTFSDADHKAITALTLIPPRQLGFPWSQWSLAKLREAVVIQGLAARISEETLRRILRQNQVTFQRTKTWKESKDPDFHAKRARINSLYATPPADGIVLCVDEWGPLEIRPYSGRHWAPTSQPQRLPATFKRPHGVRHFLAYLDLQANYLDGRIYDRKRGDEFLDFLQWLRSRYPQEQKLYIILDNFSPHRRHDVQAWAAQNRIEFVFIATNASWMNRIEAHFGPLKQFVLSGSYPRSHTKLERHLCAYLEWRNANPDDKTILQAQRKIRVA